jgi:hypothetical protein
MKLIIKADASAYVSETWHVEVPDDTPEGELHDAAWAKLSAGDAEFVGQEVDGEHNREITSVEVVADA